MAAVPAVAAVPIASQAQTSAPPAQADSLKLSSSGLDSVGKPVAKFFTPAQFSALERLADLLVPALDSRPGAKAADAPAFLDFLLSQSDAATQELYRSGLDRLNADAGKKHGKPFSSTTPEEAASLVAPLQDAWTYHGPTDPFARFLVGAKDDILRATVNSRAFAAAATTRGASGSGYYWFPVE